MPPRDMLRFALPIRQFSWDSKRKMLTAFVSDLPNSWLAQVWSDACDVGLKVKGARQTKLFLLAKEEKREGDLVAWHLSEYRGDWRMTVFND